MSFNAESLNPKLLHALSTMAFFPHENYSTVLNPLFNAAKLDIERSFEERFRLAESFSPICFRQILEAHLTILLNEEYMETDDSILSALLKTELADFFAAEIMTAMTQFVSSRIDGEDAIAELISSAINKLTQILKCAGLSKYMHGKLKIQIINYAYKLKSKIIGARLFETIETGFELIVLPESSRLLLNIVWSNFSNQLSTKLLHVSRSTADIISNIVRAVPVLLKLDPSAELLENFLKLSKAYLREKRKLDFGLEIVRQIVKLLSEKLKIKRNQLEFDAPDVDERNFDASMLGDVRKSTKSGSFVCMLINFFHDSLEFITEFKSWLIKQLLIQRFESDLSSEELLVQKLKLSIKADEWKECDVILSDFKKFRHSNFGALQPFQISSVFWPEFEPDSFFIPTCLNLCNEQDIKESLSDSDKELVLTNSISFVELVVDFETEKVEVVSSADEASILALLNGEGPKTVDQLTEITGFARNRVLSALIFWMKKRIVSFDEQNSFFVVSSYSSNAPDIIDFHIKMWTDVIDKDNLSEPIEIVSEHAKLIPLVCGMISNLGAMPTGSIHHRLLQISHGYRCTESELHSLLETQIKSGSLKLTVEGFYDVTRKI